MTTGPEREALMKLFAQTAKKHVKSLSGPAETVRYIAGTVSRSARKAIRLEETAITGPGKEGFLKDAVLVAPLAAKTKGLAGEGGRKI